MWKRLTWMNPGVLGDAICAPCCRAGDVGAMAVAVRAWRQPIQRKPLPHSCALAIGCQEVLMLGIDTLQGRVTHHNYTI